MIGRLLRRILTLVAIGLLLVVALSLYRYFTGEGAAMLTNNAVAIVSVEGVIEESKHTVQTLDRLADNEAIRAVVLRVDSPGGGVAPSQEIYDAVVRVRAKKPIVASFGGVAASGGYYVASACDQIVSNAGTLTGSIGVIMEMQNYIEVMKKIGLHGFVIKAGKYKDIGSPLREMSEEERRLLESLVENVHGQFVAAVAKGRQLPVEEVRKIADGRIYSGEQALELRLVDRLGGLRDAVDLAATRAGIEGEPRWIEFEESQPPWWWRRVSGLIESGLGGAAGPGGLRFLYSGPTSAG